MTIQTTAAPDQSLFIVMRDWGKLGLESVSEPEMTRESIAEDIAKGQIYNVVYVIECNPVEGWSKTVTDEIFAAAEVRKQAREAA